MAEKTEESGPNWEGFVMQAARVKGLVLSPQADGMLRIRCPIHGQSTIVVFTNSIQPVGCDCTTADLAAALGIQPPTANLNPLSTSNPVPPIPIARQPARSFPPAGVPQPIHSQVTQPIQFKPPVDLMDIVAEPPTFAAAGILPETGTALLVGPRGSGKSHVGLQIMATLCNGPHQPVTAGLFGNPKFHIAKASTNGLILTAEEDGGEVADLWRNVLAGCGFVPSRGVHHKFAYEEDSSPPLTLETIGFLLESSKAAGVEYGIVLVDSLTSFLPSGIDGDKDNTAVRQAMNKVRSFARKHGVLFLIVAHTGKDTRRGTRGASEFENAADCVLQMGRTKNKNVVSIENTKQRKGAAAKKFKLRLDWGEDGEFCAVYMEEGGPSRDSEKHEDTEPERKVFVVLKTQQRASIAQLGKLTGVPRSTVRSVLGRFVEMGRAIRTPGRNNNSPIYEIANRTSAIASPSASSAATLVSAAQAQEIVESFGTDPGPVPEPTCEVPK